MPEDQPTPHITADLLEQAYRLGVFPMGDEETGELRWYQPEPRTLIDLDHFHVPRRLAKTLRSRRFRFTVNQAFDEVIHHCARRHQADGVWITDKIIALYTELHQRGKCHSVECWREGRLAGGLYGVSLGAAFMGESMFHLERDASKASLVYLVRRLRRKGFMLLDTQFPTPHLSQFGLIMLPHEEYLVLLAKALQKKAVFAD